MILTDITLDNIRMYNMPEDNSVPSTSHPDQKSDPRTQISEHLMRRLSAQNKLKPGLLPDQALKQSLQKKFERATIINFSELLKVTDLTELTSFHHLA